jgi:uncharacterized protein
MAVSARILADGKRLHLNHGPIDLIIEADGEPLEVKRAYEVVRKRFATVLDELASELPLLRTEVPKSGLQLRGQIAREMERVCRPHWAMRVTPMAAVAGAVADEILATMIASADLARAYVNNGGDIALHLTDCQRFQIASPSCAITISSSDNIRGIATSGWRGRSFSFGIADSVTALAATAAQADVAATLIANAVDLPQSTKVKRQAACEMAQDSDLRGRLVTVDVAPLNATEILAALRSGEDAATHLQRNGFIAAATLLLSGQTRYVGHHFNSSTEHTELALSA